MFCPKCGERMPGEMTACPACGALYKFEPNQQNRAQEAFAQAEALRKKRERADRDCASVQKAARRKGRKKPLIAAIVLGIAGAALMIGIAVYLVSTEGWGEYTGTPLDAVIALVPVVLWASFWPSIIVGLFCCLKDRDCSTAFAAIAILIATYLVSLIPAPFYIYLQLAMGVVGFVYLVLRVRRDGA